MLFRSALCTTPRNALLELIEQSHPQDCKGHNLLCRGRPWPMPSWALYQQLEAEHPLAAWLAAMGPRVHHAGFDCQALGEPITALDKALGRAGMQCSTNRQNGIFPVSSSLDSDNDKLMLPRTEKNQDPVFVSFEGEIA